MAIASGFLYPDTARTERARSGSGYVPQLDNLQVSIVTPATAATSTILNGLVLSGIRFDAARISQVFVAGNPDIAQGDRLFKGGVQYAIKFVNRWPATGAAPAYLHLAIEEEVNQ